MATKTANNTFYIEIRSPKGIVYKGEVLSLSSVNNVGSFDVLPLHTNFITLIQNKLQVRRPDIKTGKPISFDVPIDSGVLYILNNKVTIFLGA